MQERADILKFHLSSAPVSPEMDLAAIAAACQGFSGADLAALAREAAMAAISEAAGPILAGGGMVLTFTSDCHTNFCQSQCMSKHLQCCIS